jgi:hypothetical protein
LLVWSFGQHPVYLKNSATREGFATYVSIAGGFSAFVIRVSGMFIKRYQSFVLEKSMIKKLYTKRTKRKDGDVDIDQLQTPLTEPQQQVMESILRRKGVSNYYWYATFHKYVGLAD